MIAESGLAALWLAAAMALCQLVLGVLALAPGRGGLAALGGAIRPVAVAQAVLVSIAFA